ncbi:hypothetical protein [Prochlorococcus marinus]|uniref:hypothetical protein n=1 Tax=Prochlorococcus marinus TaxID=1219 RepID=UPI0007BC7401|nr:hypothetical protein [Prochlorococcus marinus]KZR73742.1 hypothetical protein PMIT1320_02338 [Prochlorococcus marinus str. MIT 1320]
MIHSLDAEFQEAIRLNDVHRALAALEVLSGFYRWHSLVEKLLFYRSNRPTSISLEIALLKGIVDSTCFRKHHRAYAEVSLAYRAVACEDFILASEVKCRLEQAVVELEADPAMMICHRRNRENRLKRLISSKAALLHLALLKTDFNSLFSIGFLAHELLQSLDFDCVPPDVSLRMMSNFTRCLTLTAPMASQPVLLDLEILVNEAKRRRHRNSRAHEDHLGFVRMILEQLESEKVPKILTIETPMLRAALEVYWQDGLGAAKT